MFRAKIVFRNLQSKLSQWFCVSLFVFQKLLMVDISVDWILFICLFHSQRKSAL